MKYTVDTEVVNGQGWLKFQLLITHNVIGESR